MAFFDVHWNFNSFSFDNVHFRTLSPRINIIRINFPRFRSVFKTCFNGNDVFKRAQANFTLFVQIQILTMLRFKIFVLNIHLYLTVGLWFTISTQCVNIVNCINSSQVQFTYLGRFTVLLNHHGLVGIEFLKCFCSYVLDLCVHGYYKFFDVGWYLEWNNGFFIIAEVQVLVCLGNFTVVNVIGDV